MFEKFGEFDSAEELNLAAEGFAGEGDLESLRALAEENGIDGEEVDDYMSGYKDELASEFEAAVGRLKVQENEAPDVLISIALELCSESREFCTAVMKRGKRVRTAFEALKDEARKEARQRFARGETMASVCETDRDKEKLLKSYFMNSDEIFKRTLGNLVAGGHYESI